MKAKVLAYTALCFQQVDERHEKLSLVPILVQVVGVPIAGSQQNQSMAPKTLKQPLQDGSVCHVGHLEFIQEEQPRFLCPARGHSHQGVVSALGALELKEFSVDAPHKLVEVLLLLLLYAKRTEEHL